MVQEAFDAVQHDGAEFMIASHNQVPSSSPALARRWWLLPWI
jgi:hypothetical protein